jgi:hypothetical protein
VRLSEQKGPLAGHIHKMNNGRRKTLAGLSPAQLNTRASLGPARVAKDNKTSGKLVPISGRPSLAPRLPANNAPASRPAAGTGVQRRQVIAFGTCIRRPVYLGNQ